MRLPKVVALQCDSRFNEIACFVDGPKKARPTALDWVRLAFSIEPDSRVHPNMLRYPFIFCSAGMGLFSRFKAIMADCVPTFRTYSLVLAMSESWNAAAAQTFGCQKCMEQLGKLYRLHGLLEEQTTGQVPEHPIIDQHVPEMVLALSNMRAIDIMSSDDALNETQAHRRIQVRCKIWKMVIPLKDHEFWGKFVAKIIQQQKHEIAELFIKIVLKFSSWPGATLANATNEAKLLLPYTRFTEARCHEIRDLARCDTGVKRELGIAANMAKNLPPALPDGLLYIKITPQSFEELVGPKYVLEKVL